MKPWLDRHVSARLMFLIGIFIAPSLVIPASIISKVLQLIILLSIAFILGRKLRLNRLIFFALMIVMFNLFSPNGRVLIELMNFPITTGALSIGIKKAISLTGLFVLSKIIVRKDLWFPGAIGRHVSLTLNYFNTFSDLNIKLFAVNPIKNIDLILRSAQRTNYNYSAKDSNATSLKGGLIVIGLMLVSWLLSLGVK